MENLKQNEYRSYSPNFDLWGNPLDEFWEFLKLPQNIGNMLGAYSDIIKGTMPLTTKQKTVGLLVGFFIALIIGGLIYLIFKPSIAWTIIWFVIPITVILLIVNSLNKFEHTNLFIGDNGFAKYKWKRNRDNLIVDVEVNFNDITDVYWYQVENRVNYSYTNTEYICVFFNANNGEVPYVETGSFNKKDKYQPVYLEFCRKIEHLWTKYLQKNMNKQIEENGYIIFNFYSHEKNVFGPYVKLGMGQITFIKSNHEEFTYKFSDIKRMYSKGNNLYIEHNNFQTKFFFFKSGNADVIPMLNICNRRFFFQSMEILLGYKI
jgi:hypothetical protein